MRERDKRDQSWLDFGKQKTFRKISKLSNNVQNNDLQKKQIHLTNTCIFFC